MKYVILYGICVRTHMWGGVQLTGVSSLSYPMDPVDGLGLSSKLLYLLSHLAGPPLTTFYSPPLFNKFILLLITEDCLIQFSQKLDFLTKYCFSKFSLFLNAKD